MHRIVTSDEYRTDLRVLLSTWTLKDLVDAHLVLDALEEAREYAAARSKSQGW